MFSVKGAVTGDITERVVRSSLLFPSSNAGSAVVMGVVLPSLGFVMVPGSFVPFLEGSGSGVGNDTALIEGGGLIFKGGGGPFFGCGVGLPP